MGKMGVGELDNLKRICYPDSIFNSNKYFIINLNIIWFSYSQFQIFIFD